MKLYYFLSLSFRLSIFMIQQKQEIITMFEINTNSTNQSQMHPSIINHTNQTLPKNSSPLKNTLLDESTSLSQHASDSQIKLQSSPFELQKQVTQQEHKKIKVSNIAQKNISTALQSNQQNISENATPQQKLQQLKIDLYMLDYNNESKSYYPIKSKKNGAVLFVKQMADLLLSKPRYHVKTYNNLKEVENYLSSPSKIMKPLVIPLLDGTQYGVVFETLQFRKSSEGYISFDRFFIFISNHFLPYTFIEMIKKIVKKQHDNRFSLKEGYEGLDYRHEKLKTGEVQSLIIQSLLKDIDLLIVLSEKYPLSEDRTMKHEEEDQLAWYLRNIQTYDILVRLNNLHYYSVSLLTLLLFFVIREYKIVFVGEKKQRHIMSEMIMGVKAALSPIHYCYPTVLLTLSEKHNNFLDAPVPCMVGFWGDEKSCAKLSKQFNHMLHNSHKSGQMPCVLIDLSQMSITQKVLSEQQSRQLVQMHDYSKKIDKFLLNQPSNSQSYLPYRLNDYILKELISKQSDVATFFKKSQLYQMYEAKNKEQN